MIDTLVEQNSRLHSDGMRYRIALQTLTATVRTGIDNASVIHGLVFDGHAHQMLCGATRICVLTDELESAVKEAEELVGK